MMLSGPPRFFAASTSARDVSSTLFPAASSRISWSLSKPHIPSVQSTSVSPDSSGTGVGGESGATLLPAPRAAVRICLWGCDSASSARIIAVVHQAGHVGVVVGQAGNRGVADQIEPAIADVSEIQAVLEHSDRRTRRPHAMQVRILLRIVLDAVMGYVEAVEQPGARIAGDAVGIYLFDDFNRDAAGFLAAFVPAHAVGDDRQPALEPELLIVRRLPIGIAVFIIGSLAAHIAETRQLNSGPNSHSTPFDPNRIVDYTGQCDAAGRRLAVVGYPESRGIRCNHRKPQLRDVRNR